MIDLVAIFNRELGQTANQCRQCGELYWGDDSVDETLCEDCAWLADEIDGVE